MPVKIDNIQSRLFEIVGHTISDTVSLVDELSSLLQISTNSMYRRMNGEVPLSIEEVESICNMYNISFDSLRGFKGHGVTFDFSPMSAEINFINYLLSIQHDLEAVYRSKGTTIYAAEDIPIFYNFGLESLAKFKLFYWMKSVMNVPSLEEVKYDSNLISNDILEAGRALYDMYAKVHSIEIWTEMTAMSLFKQIEFLWETGLFVSREDAITICDDVKVMFNLLEKSAMQGYKFDSQQKLIEQENNYKLYWSEIEIGNNCILTETENCKTAYLAFNTFNKLTTRNQLFCDEIEKWLKNLIRKSNLISDVSEKKRSQFFKLLNDQADMTRSKILG
jgi:hypothetical protein